MVYFYVEEKSQEGGGYLKNTPGKARRRASGRRASRGCGCGVCFLFLSSMSDNKVFVKRVVSDCVSLCESRGAWGWGAGGAPPGVPGSWAAFRGRRPPSHGSAAGVLRLTPASPELGAPGSLRGAGRGPRCALVSSETRYLISRSRVPPGGLRPGLLLGAARSARPWSSSGPRCGPWEAPTSITTPGAKLRSCKHSAVFHHPWIHQCTHPLTYPLTLPPPPVRPTLPEHLACTREAAVGPVRGTAWVRAREGQGQRWPRAAGHGGGGSRASRFGEGRGAPPGSPEPEVPFACAWKGSGAGGTRTWRTETLCGD